MMIRRDAIIDGVMIGEVGVIHSNAMIDGVWMERIKWMNQFESLMDGWMDECMREGGSE